MTEGDEKKKTKSTAAKKATKASRPKKKATKPPVAKTSSKTTATEAETQPTAAKKPAKRARTTRPKAQTGRRLRVKQVRSTIHRQKRFLRTLSALGLKHHQDEVVVVESPSIRGMLDQVRSFVRVTPEEG